MDRAQNALSLLKEAKTKESSGNIKTAEKIYLGVAESMLELCKRTAEFSEEHMKLFRDIAVKGLDGAERVKRSVQQQPNDVNRIDLAVQRIHALHVQQQQHQQSWGYGNGGFPNVPSSPPARPPMVPKGELPPPPSLPGEFIKPTKPTPSRPGASPKHPASLAASYYERLSAQSAKVMDIYKACKAKGEMFVDPVFKASDESLYGPAGKAAAKEQYSWMGKVAGWKRPHEIIGKPFVFKDKQSAPGDVIQGSLGDCWFLGALSIYWRRDRDLKSIAFFQDVQHGMYVMRFYRDRKLVKVIIDDYLPVDKYGRLIFGSNRRDEEFWVALVEKAYAKLCGSYIALEGGNEGDALADMTGGVPMVLDLSKQKTDDVWSMLLAYDKAGHMMGCANHYQPIRANIEQAHAYEILGVYLYKKIKLLKLRNPWGSGEYTGRLSRHSEGWNALPSELTTKLRPKDLPEGAFYIYFEEFRELFDRIYLCKVIPPNWKTVSATGIWSNKTAGGCTNFPTWINNPQFAVISSEVTDAYIILDQAETRRAGSKDEYASIGFYMFSNVPTGETPGKHCRRVLRVEKENLFTQTAFCNMRERNRMVTLGKSTYESPYVIVPCTYDPGVKGAFKVTICSEKPVELVPITAETDWIEETLDGKWTPGRNGGCSNNDTWRQNPQYKLSIQKEQIIYVRVSQQWTKDCPAIGFYVLGDGEKRRTGEIVASTKTFIQSEAAGDYIKLQPSSKPYTIVPATFNPGVVSNFQVSVFSELKGTVSLRVATASDEDPLAGSRGTAPSAPRSQSFKIKQEDLQKLMQMGFSSSEASQALLAVGDDGVEAAVRWLLSRK